MPPQSWCCSICFVMAYRKHQLDTVKGSDCHCWRGYKVHWSQHEGAKNPSFDPSLSPMVHGTCSEVLFFFSWLFSLTLAWNLKQCGNIWKQNETDGEYPFYQFSADLSLSGVAVHSWTSGSLCLPSWPEAVIWDHHGVMMSRAWLEVISFFEDLRPWTWQCWALTAFRTLKMMIDDDWWWMMKDFLSNLRTCLSTPARFVIKRFEDDGLRNFKLKLDVLEDWHPLRWIDLLIWRFFLPVEKLKEQTSSYADYTWIKSHRLLDKTKDTITVILRVATVEDPNLFARMSTKRAKTFISPGAQINGDHDDQKRSWHVEVHPPSLSKPVCEAFRLLDFGCQLAEHGNIPDLTAANNVFDGVKQIWEHLQIQPGVSMVFQMWQFSACDSFLFSVA